MIEGLSNLKYHFIVIFLFILTLTNSASARKRHATALNIHLNFNECVNCNSYLGTLKGCNPDLEIVFWIKKSQESILKEFLKAFDLREYSVKILREKSSDSSYKGSYCIYQLSEDFKFKFSLEELPKYDRIFNHIGNSWPNPKEIEIDKVPLLSTNLRTHTEDSLVIRFDYVLNKVVVFEIGNKIAQTREIQLPGSLKQEIFRKFDLDSIFYYSVLPYITPYNKDKLRIQSVFWRKKECWVSLALPFPIKEQNDTAIVDFIYLVSLSANGEIVQLVECIGPVNINAELTEIDFQDGFIFHNGDLVTCTYQSFPENERTHPMLAVAQIKNGRINSLRPLKSPNLPESYLKDSLFYDFTGSHFTKNLYVMYSYPKIFDFDLDKEWEFNTQLKLVDDLDADNHKNDFDFFMADAIMIEEGLYRIAYAKKGDFRIAIYDAYSGALLIQDFFRPKRIFSNSIRFLDSNTLHTIRTDYKTIYLYNLE